MDGFVSVLRAPHFSRRRNRSASRLYKFGYLLFLRVLARQ